MICSLGLVVTNHTFLLCFCAKLLPKPAPTHQSTNHPSPNRPHLLLAAPPCLAHPNCNPIPTPREHKKNALMPLPPLLLGSEGKVLLAMAGEMVWNWLFWERGGGRGEELFVWCWVGFGWLWVGSGRSF